LDQSKAIVKKLEKSIETEITKLKSSIANQKPVSANRKQKDSAKVTDGKKIVANLKNELEAAQKRTSDLTEALTPDTYLSKMRKKYRWGGHFELLVLSILLKKNYMVYQIGGKMLTVKLSSLN
jgi:hypothetical protein